MTIFSLEGRVALVTGASRGLGKAIALDLARAGAAVGLIARDTAALDAVAASIEAVGGRALALPADVDHPEDVVATTQRCESDLGPVDVLVNNAGINSRGPIWEIELAEWDAVIRTNLTSAYLFCHAVAPGLRERRWGRIINIASITAQYGGISGSVAYSASKGGMLALTKSLARDLAPYNVTVNAICPGQIATDMGSDLTDEQLRTVLAAIPLGRLGTPEHIAGAVRYLASEEGGFITGATLDVNGGTLKR